MRKTLILIAVLIFSICFSACESVSAHSPRVEKQMVKYEKVSAVAAVSEETSPVQVETFAAIRAPDVNYLRESTLETTTHRTAPDLRGNPISIVKPDENYRQGTDYIQPPDRFSGFGSDNNARAKI